MPYFHCGPSRQEKILIRLDQNGGNNINNNNNNNNV